MQARAELSDDAAGQEGSQPAGLRHGMIVSDAVQQTAGESIPGTGHVDGLYFERLEEVFGIAETCTGAPLVERHDHVWGDAPQLSEDLVLVFLTGVLLRLDVIREHQLGISDRLLQRLSELSHDERIRKSQRHLDVVRLRQLDGPPDRSSPAIRREEVPLYIEPLGAPHHVFADVRRSEVETRRPHGNDGENFDPDRLHLLPIVAPVRIITQQPAERGEAAELANGDHCVGDRAAAGSVEGGLAKMIQYLLALAGIHQRHSTLLDAERLEVGFRCVHLEV